MNFEAVAEQLGGVGGVGATTPAQGRVLHDFVLSSGVRDVLELGFAHGNSTCYIAAALAERGNGSVLTIDRAEARQRRPSIIDLLEQTGLGSFVTPVFAESSYTWELMRLLEQQREGRGTRPRFDFAFIDGAHSWETDGLAFFLVDKLLKPGGWILFDDVHWTFAGSPTMRGTEMVSAMPESERTTPQVMRVFGLLVMQHPGYDEFRIEGNWAWARKRPERVAEAVTPGLPVELVRGSR